MIWGLPEVNLEVLWGPFWSGVVSWRLDFGPILVKKRVADRVIFRVLKGCFWRLFWTFWTLIFMVFWFLRNVKILAGGATFGVGFEVVQVGLRGVFCCFFGFSLERLARFEKTRQQNVQLFPLFQLFHFGQDPSGWSNFFSKLSSPDRSSKAKWRFWTFWKTVIFSGFSWFLVFFALHRNRSVFWAGPGKRSIFGQILEFRVF